MSKHNKSAKTQAARLAVVNVALVDGKHRPKVEDVDALNAILSEGWIVAACAATRSDGFNHDRLYYTLVK